MICVKMPGSSTLSHSVKSGFTENGTTTHAAPVTILGLLKRNVKNNIFSEDEQRRFNHVVNIAGTTSVNIGDLIDGCEVTTELPGRNRWGLE